MKRTDLTDALLDENGPNEFKIPDMTDSQLRTLPADELRSEVCHRTGNNKNLRWNGHYWDCGECDLCDHIEDWREANPSPMIS